MPPLPNPIRSVLIVKLSAIGDVVHALPTLSALRTLLPEARIGWMVEQLSSPLLENHPDLDVLHIVPRRRWRKEGLRTFLREAPPYFRAIREEQWDVAIDMQGLTKSGMVAWASGAKHRVGFGDAEMREFNRFFTHTKVRPEPGLHKAAHNLALLRGLGLDPDLETSGTIGLLDSEKDAMRRALAEVGAQPGDRLLALNPGAGWDSKRWEPAKFAQVGATLAREFGLRPLVVWGPGEEAWRDEIEAKLKAEDIPVLVAPPTRIRELAVMISLCSFFIGGDTGPTHMAGLLRVPTVAVFGASDGDRNRPWPIKGTRIAWRRELECIMCWDTKCKIKGPGHMACLRGLEAERVAALARELLA